MVDSPNGPVRESMPPIMYDRPAGLTRSTPSRSRRLVRGAGMESESSRQGRQTFGWCNCKIRSGLRNGRRLGEIPLRSRRGPKNGLRGISPRNLTGKDGRGILSGTRQLAESGHLHRLRRRGMRTELTGAREMLCETPPSRRTWKAHRLPRFMANHRGRRPLRDRRREVVGELHSFPDPRSGAIRPSPSRDLDPRTPRARAVTRGRGAADVTRARVRADAAPWPKRNRPRWRRTPEGAPESTRNGARMAFTSARNYI